ncbi:hypothetical protein HKX23_16535 [Sulfitobacter sp. KE29]|uniref:hypothetical protein n=1 Tax=unclassified Sulfitobacter TaxID=196795 RepID=UPI0023E26BEE|nr:MULTISPECIES: hypothetical protein [unclassified Sulfitobacter]MDF3419967.1 hypothetical protein [Sulfitobacter sp. Ks38]MDF3427450.1 hypothetical protein [Sulfitobacter sp. KE29]MDF3431031.1 hypothetical protein [Sulfitobacter sp. S46]MDF3445803.1 hypothetical protein [Sulfitobacter sp. KE31]MDF3549582.1 hypothetical protein [Sulfitobacter sp. KE28]
MQNALKTNTPDIVQVSAARAHRLTSRPDLSRPIGQSRTTPLTWLFNNLSQKQIETVINALRDGFIEGYGYIGWLELNLPLRRMSPRKTPLTAAEWHEHYLRYSADGNAGPQVHLIDNINERVFINITLNSSQVNRVLGLTGQSGGQHPKMGPRLYAWLAAFYAHSDLPTNPEVLFSILIEEPELWENGEIDDVRGIAAIGSYLSSLEEFSARSWPPDYYDKPIAKLGSQSRLEVSTQEKKGDFNA